MPLKTVTKMEPMSIPGFILIPSEGGVLEYIPDNCPFDWVKEFTLNVKMGEYHPPTKDVSDIVGKVLILSDSEKDFFNKYEMFFNWYNKNLVWKELS